MNKSAICIIQQHNGEEAERDQEKQKFCVLFK